MSPRRFASARSLRVFAAWALATLPPAVTAEDFSLRVSDGNRAFTEAFFPTLDAGIAGLKGGFDASVSARATYDSNFFLDDDYATSELYFELAPMLEYRTDPEGGAEFAFEGYYSPAFKAYLNNEDLNAVDHSAGAAFRYAATRTTFRAYVDYAEVSMADRLAGGFIEGSILSYGITGSYQLASRTSLLAGWSAAESDYDSGARSGSDVYTTEIAGLWDATERLRFGPSIRHTLTDSTSTGERDAIAALVNTRYKWGERILLDAALGIEFAKNSRSNSGRESGFTGRIAADYRLTERWTVRAGARYSTVPSPNNLNYLVNDLSFSASVIRSFERSSLEIGCGVSFSDYEAVGAIAALREDDEFLNAYLTYRRTIYSDRISLESTLRTARNRGQNDWSQWQISTGLRVEF
jgi:opacity protein-like surface antigen